MIRAGGDKGKSAHTRRRRETRQGRGGTQTQGDVHRKSQKKEYFTHVDRGGIYGAHILIILNRHSYITTSVDYILYQ